MRVAKFLLGVIFASLVTTLMFLGPVAIINLLIRPEGEYQILGMLPLIYGFSLLGISLPTALIIELFRFIKADAHTFCLVSGLVSGLGWAMAAGIVWEEGFLSSSVLCPSGVFSAMAYRYTALCNSKALLS